MSTPQVSFCNVVPDGLSLMAVKIAKRMQWGQPGALSMMMKIAEMVQ